MAATTDENSRRRRGSRRLAHLALIVFGAVVLLSGAWVAVTAVLARSQLSAVSTDVSALRAQILAGNVTAARQTVTAMGEHSRRARKLTRGPAWAAAADLPLVGDPVRTIRGITTGVDELASSVLPRLISVGDQLDPATLRRPDGSIDIVRLASVGPQLASARAAVGTTTSQVRHLPAGTWLPAVDHRRRQLVTQLANLGADLRAVGSVVDILPPMLGQDGPKRYFVAFQNEAEARGTGGLPGAFAILRADRGRLTFERFESNQLSGVTADVNFGADYDHLYDGAGTTTLYGNANLSPNFPYAAEVWASMWHKHSGQRLDGAIAVDPTALSYLLAVTGPATLPDRTEVTAGNIVALTQSTVYAKFPDLLTQNTARRKYLLDVARAVSVKVLAGGGDSTHLVAGAVRAAAERRLLVWSADPSLETQIEPTAVSGVIPETSAPYVGLSIVNDAGNKLDYYLDRSLSWQRTGCGPTRTVTVTITLTNNAPAGLPEYVRYRSDAHSYPVRPGDNRLMVSYFATKGALMRSVTIDGKATTATLGMERGHPVYTVDLELPRGTARTVVLHLTEPAGSGAPIVLRQPLVRPLSVTVNDARCH